MQDGTPGGMSNLPAAGAKTGGYVPPSIRNRAAGDTGDSMNKRREENSVRVTNLSEDTREDDLRVCTACLDCRVAHTHSMQGADHVACSPQPRLLDLSLQ